MTDHADRFDEAAAAVRRLAVRVDHRPQNRAQSNLVMAAEAELAEALRALSPPEADDNQRMPCGARDGDNRCTRPAGHGDIHHDLHNGASWLAEVALPEAPEPNLITCPACGAAGSGNPGCEECRRVKAPPEAPEPSSEEVARKVAAVEQWVEDDRDTGRRLLAKSEDWWLDKARKETGFTVGAGVPPEAPEEPEGVVSMEYRVVDRSSELCGLRYSIDLILDGAEAVRSNAVYWCGDRHDAERAARALNRLYAMPVPEAAKVAAALNGEADGGEREREGVREHGMWQEVTPELLAAARGEAEPVAWRWRLSRGETIQEGAVFGAADAAALRSAGYEVEPLFAAPPAAVPAPPASEEPKPGSPRAVLLRDLLLAVEEGKGPLFDQITSQRAYSALKRIADYADALTALDRRAGEAPR